MDEVVQLWTIFGLNLDKLDIGLFLKFKEYMAWQDKKRFCLFKLYSPGYKKQANKGEKSEFTP